MNLFFKIKDTAKERAMAIFKLLDFNKDGEINEEEFVQVFRFYR